MSLPLDLTCAVRNAVRSSASGSGTSIEATCGLPVSRSATLDSRGSISTNAMLRRLTYGDSTPS